MKNDYLTQLKDHLIQVIRDHPNGLRDVIKQLDGAFPSDIVKILAELKAEYPEASKLLEESSNNFEALHDGKNTRLKWIESNLKKLSKAHPADYDWRFTPDTTDNLSQLIYNEYSPQKVGLFGVTTLYIVLRHFYPKIDTYLVNKSSSLINDLKMLGYSEHLINHDLFIPLPTDLKLDLIVADPPWYLDFYKAFILRASQNLKVNGYMMLSVLPRLTRPNADEDIQLIDDFCTLCGLKIVDTKHKYLTYETPDFEQKSLHENLLSIENWRFGDLVIYQKVADVPSSMILGVEDSDPEWLEFSLAGRKIKISKNDDQNKKFGFSYVADHKILPSVSRRYENRHKINFWTSDNIAFNVTNLALLKAFFANAVIGSAVDASLKRAANRLNLNDDDLITLTQLLREAELL